jgi:hypothetical protein
MDDNTPVAIPWWQSRIIWAQLIGIAFTIAATFGLNLADKLGMDEAALVGVIMAIINVATIAIRVLNPTPVVTGTKAAAAQINREAAARPQASMAAASPVSGNFGADALRAESERRSSRPKAPPRSRR